MKKMFMLYMINNDIPSFKELARMSGIRERNLLKKIANPSMFRLYELRAVDEVLHFSDADFVKLARGQE